MSRFLAILAGSLAMSLLGSCSSYKEATGPEAMWYQYVFEGEYQGKPFKIDQMVTCMRKRFSGGFLGQSPDTQIYDGYPRTAAAKMADDSQVLIRIPNMCTTHRAYEIDRDRDLITFKPGWHSPGPHEIIPLVIWSDSTTKPTRVESYIARTYYTHPQARIKNPKGSVRLWPVGKYPENYKEVMEKEEAQPFYPHPNVRDGKRSTNYLGKEPQFMAFIMIPVSDPIEAWEKYSPDLHGRINEDYIRDTPPIGSVKWDDETLTIYNQDNPPADQVGKYVPLPDYMYKDCVRGALSKLLTGGRAMVGPTLNESLLTTAYRVEVRTLKNSPEDQEKKRVEAIWRQKDSNCYKQLGQTRTFDNIDGRLDASAAIPGSIIYRRWGRPSFADYRANGSSTSPVLRKMNLADKQQVYLRIEGKPISIYFYRVEYYVKIKENNKWYFLYDIHRMYSGGPEFAGFN